MPRLIGTQNHRSKLTDADVLRIRAEYVPGRISLEALGRKYGLGRSATASIINRKTWTHVAEGK
jgi:hypothetical protein